MSGYLLVRKAVDAADSPDNHGNGYTLRVHLRGGRSLHGGLMKFDDRILELDLWERNLGGHERPSGSQAYIDVTEVAAVEVVW